MSAPRSSIRSTSSVSPLEQAARNTAPSSNFTFVFFFFRIGGSRSVSEPSHRFNCSFLFCLASAIFIPLLSRASYLSPREDILYSATIPQRTGAWEGRAGERRRRREGGGAERRASERGREERGREREGVWVVFHNLARCGALELQYNVIISRLWGERVSRVIPYRLCTPNKTRAPENIT